MKWIFTALLVALATTSCQKEFGPGTGEQNPVVPADFTWKMTQDVSLTAGMPTINGVAPQYAGIAAAVFFNAATEKFIVPEEVKAELTNTVPSGSVVLT